MRVLVACEFSGVVRDAFAEQGHDAWSCDLEPCETGGQHFEGDVIEVLERESFDLMVAHPPCTHLAVSGARWFKGKQEQQQEAISFVRRLMKAPVVHIAIENPVSVLSSEIGKPTQVVQPWQFGHGETKATCLWLKFLPPLVPTDVVEGRDARIHRMPPGENRSRERSRTLPGVAKAMASQWGALVCESQS